MLRTISFMESTLTREKYLIKVSIELIVNQFSVNFRKVLKYSDRSVNSFITFFFFFTGVISAYLNSGGNASLSIQ